MRFLVERRGSELDIVDETTTISGSSSSVSIAAESVFAGAWSIDEGPARGGNEGSEVEAGATTARVELNAAAASTITRGTVAPRTIASA